MSEFKGTPGPWVNVGGWVDSKGKDSKIICAIASVSSQPEEIQEADSNLIAAAPELLEACLRIQAQFRQSGIESKAGSLNPIEDNAAQIDAVILKALGQ